MNRTQLNAIRKIAAVNESYSVNTKTLIIKKGRLAGRYENISQLSAIELVKANK